MNIHHGHAMPTTENTMWKPIDNAICIARRADPHAHLLSSRPEISQITVARSPTPYSRGWSTREKQSPGAAGCSNRIAGPSCASSRRAAHRPSRTARRLRVHCLIWAARDRNGCADVEDTGRSRAPSPRCASARDASTSPHNAGQHVFHPILEVPVESVGAPSRRTSRPLAVSSGIPDHGGAATRAGDQRRQRGRGSAGRVRRRLLREQRSAVHMLRSDAHGAKPSAIDVVRWWSRAG